MEEDKAGDEKMIQDAKKKIEDAIVKPGEQSQDKDISHAPDSGKKPDEEPQDEIHDLKDKISGLESADLKRKVEELGKIEKRVDSKINQLREIVDETNKEGKGFMFKKELTPEEKQKEEANKMLGGFGYHV